jgi:hypothetical protein
MRCTDDVSAEPNVWACHGEHSQEAPKSDSGAVASDPRHCSSSRMRASQLLKLMVVPALLLAVLASTNGWAALAATTASSCGQLHLKITLVQDQTSHPGVTTTERLVVFHGLRCATARRAVTIYFTTGPRPCEGSGCYGRSGGLWCGEDKAGGTAVVCTRSENSNETLAELLAVY